MIREIEKNEQGCKFVFRFCKGKSANLSVQVIDGELAYVSRWGEKDEYYHDIEKHPNWEHAKELLESFAKYYPDEFFDIAKLLNLNSRGYKVVKSISEKQIANYESRISKIMEEAKFFRSFI